MNWVLKTEALISQLLNGDVELFNQLADAVWFNRTLDDDSREALARAIADKFDSIKDVDTKSNLLRLMGWANSELACSVALNNLENGASEAVRHSQYLYESLLVIARERSDVFDRYTLSSIGIEKNLRLSFALLRNKPIIEGDCLEASELSNAEFAGFMKDLRKWGKR